MGGRGRKGHNFKDRKRRDKGTERDREETQWELRLGRMLENEGFSALRLSKELQVRGVWNVELGTTQDHKPKDIPRSQCEAAI
jgi:hypothetical protein